MKPRTGTSGGSVPSAASAALPPQSSSHAGGRGQAPRGTRPATAQLLVLIGLLAAESVAVVTAQELVARGWIRRRSAFV